MKFKSMFMALVLLAVPVVSMADSIGAAKCQKAADKFVVKVAKLASKAGAKACKAGGSEASLLSEMGPCCRRRIRVCARSSRNTPRSTVLERILIG